MSNAIDNPVCMRAPRAEARQFPDPLARGSDTRGAAQRAAVVLRDRVSDSDALQVGRGPRRHDERALPLPARGRAAEGGEERAVAASTVTSARPTPASSTTSSRSISRTTPCGRCAFFDWVETVVRPRRAQAHVPVEGLGQPHRRQRAAARVAQLRSPARRGTRSAPASAQARVVPPSGQTARAWVPTSTMRPVVHDADDVGALHRGQPMGDDQRRAVPA